AESTVISAASTPIVRIQDYGLWTAQRMLQCQPSAILPGTGHGLGNKIHSIHAVCDVRIKALASIHLLSRCPRNHVLVSSGIDVGKCFKKRLGMAARQPAGRLAGAGHVGSIWIARVEAVRLAVGAYPHL